MQASDERLGIVRLSLPDGRAVPLRFTWARIDAVGRDWIIAALTRMIEGKAGCQEAMAELLVLASGGEIKASDLFGDEGPALGFETAYRAIEDAWLLARFGPSRKPEDAKPNPQMTRRIWWKPSTWLRSKRV